MRIFPRCFERYTNISIPVPKFLGLYEITALDFYSAALHKTSEFKRCAYSHFVEGNAPKLLW